MGHIDRDLQQYNEQCPPHLGELRETDFLALFGNQRQRLDTVCERQ